MVGKEPSAGGSGGPYGMGILIKSGPDCFGMVLQHLQGREYKEHLRDLNDSREGDILMFSSSEHGVALAIHAGKDRGYTFVKGRIALLRFRDLLRNGQFLAGVRLG